MHTHTHRNTPDSADLLGGALPLAAAGGGLALGVGDLGGLPLAVLLLIPVLGLLGICGGAWGGAGGE